MKWSLGDLVAAEQLLLRTVELDEAIGYPDLASARALLERVRQERRAGWVACVALTKTVYTTAPINWSVPRTRREQD